MDHLQSFPGHFCILLKTGGVEGLGMRLCSGYPGFEAGNVVYMHNIVVCVPLNSNSVVFISISVSAGRYVCMNVCSLCENRSCTCSM